MSIGDVELWSIVKFCVALEKSPTKTMKMINCTGKYKKCSPATVYRWHAHFKEEIHSVEDVPRCGRQSVVAFSIKDSVKDLADDFVKHMQAIVSYFTDSWYVETYNKWISRHRKCVEIAGDYVEKVWRSMDLNVALHCKWRPCAPGVCYMVINYSYHVLVSVCMMMILSDTVQYILK